MDLFEFDFGKGLGPFLIILSALLHALWNGLLKGVREKIKTTAGAMNSALIISFILLLLDGNSALFSYQIYIWIAVAGICEGAYLYLVARAYETTTYGLAYTIMRGGAMICVWLVSVPLFGERFGMLHFLGVLLILAGMVGMNNGLHTKVSRIGVIIATRAAFLIAAYHLAYNQAISLGANPLYVFSLSMIFAVSTFYLFSYKRFRGKLIIITYDGLLAGIAFLLSLILFLYGMRETDAGLTISLRNSSLVFAALIANVLGEPLNRKEAIGMILVILGVMALSVTK
ncbi:MAG TPA: DMT family transporter [Oligoflexia bacterium]|nr:DMT family transporter [Oligoflexia bacterium]HMP27437.1 DMT family transporter [Oligoflexia bacterium]